jgi:hypothetical protein
MLFTFKRDDEGRERIYVGDVLMAGIECMKPLLAYAVAGVTYDALIDAIERADEAGFWGDEWCDDCGTTDCHTVPRKNEVTVDVPIPAQSSTVVSVVLEGDES